MPEPRTEPKLPPGLQTVCLQAATLNLRRGWGWESPDLQGQRSLRAALSSRSRPMAKEFWAVGVQSGDLKPLYTIFGSIFFCSTTYFFLLDAFIF